MMWFTVLSILFTITHIDGVPALAPDVNAESTQDDILNEEDIAFLEGRSMVSLLFAHFLPREYEETEERSVALLVLVLMADVLNEDTLGEKGTLDTVDT